MGLFDKVERGLERTVNRAFAKAFRSEVPPVEIAAAIRRAMDDRAAVLGHGRTMVPNLFTIELSSTDFGRLDEYSDALSDELVAAAQEHAESQRYTPGGPVEVAFAEGTDLETGVFRVRPATSKRSLSSGMPARPAPGARSRPRPRTSARRRTAHPHRHPPGARTAAAPAAGERPARRPGPGPRSTARRPSRTSRLRPRPPSASSSTRPCARGSTSTASATPAGPAHHHRARPRVPTSSWTTPESRDATARSGSPATARISSPRSATWPRRTVRSSTASGSPAPAWSTATGSRSGARRLPSAPGSGDRGRTHPHGLPAGVARPALAVRLQHRRGAAQRPVRHPRLQPQPPGRPARRSPQRRTTHPPAPARGGAARVPRPNTLAVTEGRLAGTIIPLRPSGILIGRNPECALVLDDDFASGRHARLFPRADGWFVEDLGSTNGTFLGGTRLSGPPQPVAVGSTLRIGRTVLELQG